MGLRSASDSRSCRPKAALLHDSTAANLTVKCLAEPGRQLNLGSFCRSYLKVDLFTAKREFDFCEAFSRSIAVEVVDGIPAQVASEGDLKILDSQTAAP